jgi:subtilisin family serine protease
MKDSKRIGLLFGLGLILFFQARMPLKPDPQTKISAGLRDAMAEVRTAGNPLHVWVYFRDKGEQDEAGLQRALAETRQTLGVRCQWRRSKMRTPDSLIDYEDLPLDSSYTEKVRTLVPRIRTISRWLNAVSVEAAPDRIQDLAALDCVADLDIVRGFKRGESIDSPGAEGIQAAAALNPIYGSAYAQLNQIGVPQLQRQGLSGRGVLVCIMDVGFRKSHEVFQLAHRIAEWDFVFGDGDVQQNTADSNDYSDAHGTATWSLLGGFQFGQMVGPAFGADFILAKTEDDRSETPIEEDFWAAGIEWAESLGAEVVSSSLGYTDWYQFKDMDGKTAVTTKAANRATSLGVVVVNAAGNERGNSWGHIIAPADGYDVIAVGAVDSSNQISSFSSPGPTSDGRIKPEVCALGVNDWVAKNRNDGSDFYARGSGTSYATPLVAGVAALLLEAHRDWTPRQVRAALMNTASNATAPNNDFGWGIVNAPAALAYAAASPILHK